MEGFYKQPRGRVGSDEHFSKKVSKIRWEIIEINFWKDKLVIPALIIFKILNLKILNHFSIDLEKIFELFLWTSTIAYFRRIFLAITQGDKINHIPKPAKTTFLVVSAGSWRWLIFSLDLIAWKILRVWIHSRGPVPENKKNFKIQEKLAEKLFL